MAATNHSAKKNHWEQMSEAGVTHGIVFLVFCYRLGGKRLFSLCLAPAIVYFYLFRFEARKASIDYLKRIRSLNPAMDTGSIHWQSFQHFWSFGQAIIDKFAVWMGDIQVSQLVPHNDDVIKKLLATDTGGILLISHLGNFEVTRCLSSRHEKLKLTVLVHTKHANKFNDILGQHSQSNHIELLEVTEIDPATAMLMSERIARGEFIVIAGDRMPVGNNNDKSLLDINFLGSIAPFPVGAYTLASIFKAPIVSLLCLQQDKKYHVYFDLISEKVNPSRKLRQQTYQNLAQSYVNLLQRHCLQTPLQWFNFYDFWAKPTIDENDKPNNKDKI